MPILIAIFAMPLAISFRFSPVGHFSYADFFSCCHFHYAITRRYAMLLLIRLLMPFSLRG
jgi:hypothetical protein